MKKIFILILVFLSVKSFSQNAYTPMNFDTSCYWVNYYSMYSDFDFCEGYILSYIEKDTIINSTTYFKMSTYFTHQLKGGTCPLYMGFLPHSIYIRDDTTLRQVLKYNGANPEKVLIDFGLDSGDVFNIGTGTFIVDSTDTFINYPRVQWFSMPGGVAEGYTIEGIGMTINFPYAEYGSFGSPMYRLECYSKNGVTLYGNSPCPKNWPLDVKNSEKDNISLNFSENILAVKNIRGSSTLSIYSLLGNKVFGEKIEGDNYSEDLSSVLQNGFYVVSINDGKSKSVLKIVVR